MFGELDARLRGAQERSAEGLRKRLALAEAADLAWWAGERFPIERLGLWLEQRRGETGEAAPALARGGWAARRLTRGPAPAEGLAAFLHRRAETMSELAALLAAGAGLHPVTQAALLFHGWRLLGPEAESDRARDLEAAVLAARHGAMMSRLPGQGALFLPLAGAGFEALNGQGSPEAKLAAWTRGTERSALAALLSLDRLRDWRRRAEAVTADLSGRVPGLLLEAFEAWPYVPAPLAETLTGASRAAVQRNLTLFEARGLLREITGQGRFRVWAARL